MARPKGSEEQDKIVAVLRKSDYMHTAYNVAKLLHKEPSNNEIRKTYAQLYSLHAQGRISMQEDTRRKYWFIEEE